GKKIVELQSGELTWARKDNIDPDTEIVNVLAGRIVTSEEVGEYHLSRIRPLIENYKRDVFPDDRLIIIREDGSLSEYPLVDAGSSSAGMRQTRRRWWPFGGKS